jgi:hypothetical protein
MFWLSHVFRILSFLILSVRVLFGILLGNYGTNFKKAVYQLHAVLDISPFLVKRSPVSVVRVSDKLLA